MAAPPDHQHNRVSANLCHRTTPNGVNLSLKTGNMHLTLMILAIIAMLHSASAQSSSRETSTDADQSQDPDIDPEDGPFPQWVLPPIFLLMLAYVEVVGRVADARRKWYLIAIWMSNVFIPYFVDKSGMQATITIWCVYQINLTLKNAFPVLTLLVAHSSLARGRLWPMPRWTMRNSVRRRGAFTF